MQSPFDFDTRNIYKHTYITVYIREITIIIQNFTDTAPRQASLICYGFYENFIKTRSRETNTEDEIYIIRTYVYQLYI